MTQDFVEIFEVGPRDGLQNEKRQIPTGEKIALVNKLSEAGFRRIEIASFVSPKWVPQMADSADVLARISRVPNISYAALTPNLKGLERAIDAKADEVAIFGSASEGFSKANINATIAESLARFVPVVEAAKTAGLPVRGYVSCVVECPYDGFVDPEGVAKVVAALRDLGCYEISLGDTIGRATPEKTDRMLSAVLNEFPAQQLAGHFHDTSGRALENISVAIERGLRVFDAAIGGLGGCPFAPGAAGNVATEAVVRHVEQAGYTTGLNMDILEQASSLAKGMRHD
ncbi:MAG: hydroxymethylglutaryl-CoA lyase [Paracoccaceae bacterium]|nr:hydroxymethylglutaryl-CoA lyase [Paracoccaceae bacterium]MDG2260329.1 hydroxymethylglutaryl-CoA lyase [Paracoccaceae bacterium]